MKTNVHTPIPPYHRNSWNLYSNSLNIYTQIDRVVIIAKFKYFVTFSCYIYPVQFAKWL